MMIFVLNFKIFYVFLYCFIQFIWRYLVSAFVQRAISHVLVKLCLFYSLFRSKIKIVLILF